MTARKVASRGGQGGREAGHNQVDEQPAEQVTNPVAPVSQADLTAMSTRLEQMFKDTVTKVLAQHQLAQAAPSQGQAAPQDLPNQLSAEAKHLRDFRIYDPQTFNGLSEDPINVMLWLSSVERIFHYMKCPDNQKVQCAVFLLRERAAIWWLSVERMLGGNVNQFTWDQFKESFYAKFFPASLRDDKRQEFIDLKQGQMTPCIVSDEEDGSGDVIAVAVTNKVMCYQKLPCDEQIKDLLRRKNFKEAISLAEDLECAGEMSKEMLYFVHAQIGFLLLFDLQFEEAVNHFLQSETMQPSEIFPFVMKDPNRWSLLIPRNRYWAMHPPPAPFEDVIDDGLLAIQRATFLKKVGVETAVNDDFLLNPPSRSDLLESAVKHIIRYLEASRDKELISAVREGVDTLLMCLYRTLNSVDKMEKLASSENSCVVEELETLLEDSGHLRTLAFLYASKGMSSKALAIWRILGRNYPSRLLMDSSMDESTMDSNVRDISGKEVAAAEASKILEESSDQALVLQHLGWIADINQHFAIQILTSEKRQSQLSPDEIIRAIDSKKVEMLQRYIQWLIEEQESCDPHFHSLYALSLAKSAVEHDSTQSLDSSSDPKISDQRLNSIFEQPIRERLQIFLQSSDLYDPEEVLHLIEGSELWLEKAILYRKLGQEALVLRILALKLEDSEAAEQYCAEIGRSDAYVQLLDMYLDPQNGKEPMFKAAVRLLHNHGESLDPFRVLETLSPNMPLHIASETILKLLRARFHHKCQGQIVHNTSRALDLEARLARLEERSRHAQINDESLCDSCHARLGTKLFAMYPDDTVVCYKCYRRQGESTSVTGRNFKQDILIKPGWLVMD